MTRKLCDVKPNCGRRVGEKFLGFCEMCYRHDVEVVAVHSESGRTKHVCVGECVFHSYKPDYMKEMSDIPIDLREKLFKRATTFTFDNRTRIEQRSPDKYVIICFKEVLNKKGAWEYEPSPSNRSEMFLARTRYSLGEAVDMVRDKLGLEV